jgi:hypothetical protein
MGPGGYSATSPSSPSSSGSIQELRDNGSNWSEYQPRMESVLVAKGLWRHVVGTAVAPEPYAMDGVPVLADGKTPATEEQIESKEDELTEFDKKEYLAQHLILSTTSTRLGVKINGIMSAKEMWEVVGVDARSESTLFVLDAENQLSSMKLRENEGLETHPEEMKEHSQMMVQRHENLVIMGSKTQDARFSTLVTLSPPESCRPTLQTVSAAEAEQALVAHGEPKAIVKGKDEEKSKAEDEGMNAKSEIACHNCGKAGHKKHACYSKGGGNEGQAPWQRKRKGKDRPVDKAAVMAANSEDEVFFACTCISEFANIAERMQVPRLRLGTCAESGESRMACPGDDGCQLGAVGMQDLEIGSITVERDKVSEEADSQSGDDTASSSHGALYEGEMESEKFIQYQLRHVQKSQNESDEVTDGVVGSHSSCYHAYPPVCAVVMQEMYVVKYLKNLTRVSTGHGSQALPICRNVTHVPSHRSPLTKSDNS